MLTVKRVQHRFSRMRDEGLKSRRDENRKGRPGYAPFRRRERGQEEYRRDHNLAQVTPHPTSEK